MKAVRARIQFVGGQVVGHEILQTADQLAAELAPIVNPFGCYATVGCDAMSNAPEFAVVGVSDKSLSDYPDRKVRRTVAMLIIDHVMALPELAKYNPRRDGASIYFYVPRK